VALFRSSEDRKARKAGVDESRIPPGQYYTDKWPVLQAGSVPRVELAAWDFRAFGLVKEPIRLSFDDLVALGAQEQISDIHCVRREIGTCTERTAEGAFYAVHRVRQIQQGNRERRDAREEGSRRHEQVQPGARERGPGMRPIRHPG
jgi:hypothetical protein